MEAATNYQPNVEIVCDPEVLARRSAEIFIAGAQKEIGTKGVFYVAISGGHTPAHFFELLGDMPQSNSLPWDKIQLFWVDERIVDADSPLSNYKLAADTFLDKVEIPQENVHPIPTEYDDFRVATRYYEQTIRDVFGLGKGQLPIFDLIVLGVGSDGHTASLFPGSYATLDTDDLACAVYVLDEDLNRITLTHPVLRAASHLVVLASGREKSEILGKILTSEPDEVKYPIHGLWPVLHKVTWLVDTAAAQFLRSQ